MQNQMMAMVLAETAASINVPKLKASVRKMLPKGAPEPNYVEHADAGHSIVLTFAGVTVAVVAMPVPIPPETYQSALAFEYIWKTSEADVSSCGGHYLVSVVDAGVDAGELFAHAQALTIVVAAALKASDGVGVYWSPAQSLIESKRFQKAARGVAKDSFASPLWIAVRILPGSSDIKSDLIVCQTKGLGVFCGREIECGPYGLPPGELAERVHLTARFMASEGPIFGEGHTFNFDGGEEPQARILFDWSGLGGVNQPVFQLRLLDVEASS